MELEKKYHAPLRRIYNKIVHDEPRIDRTLALRLAQKAMNDTMGPNGLVPSLLVFGMVPRFPAVNSKLPHQVVRMRSLEIARTEMATIVAELRIIEALRSLVSPAARYILAPGAKVRVNRETA